LDRIFGSLPPDVLETGEIKQRKRETSLVEDHKDDNKVSGNNMEYIIPMEKYTRPFKEKLNSKSFKLAPMQLHHNCFKEDYPK